MEVLDSHIGRLPLLLYTLDFVSQDVAVDRSDLRKRLGHLKQLLVETCYLLNLLLRVGIIRQEDL
jgi:hypothetical protein